MTVGVVAVIVVAGIVVVGGVISLALKYIWWDLFNDVCKTH